MNKNPSAVKNLIAEYNRRREEIKRRLKEFSKVQRGGDEDIFQELCFCILTANANALQCDRAIKEVRDSDLLLKGPARRLKPKLKGRVRFHNKKASFIVSARNLFKRGKRFCIKERLDLSDPFAAREWLVANIKG